MSTAEAAATAEAREPGTRIKSSSPRQIPAVGVVTEDEEAQGVFTSMDLNRVIKLLEETEKDDLEEKQLKSVKKVVQCYQNGLVSFIYMCFIYPEMGEFSLENMFLIAAVTNYHIFDIFKQHEFIILTILKVRSSKRILFS